MKTILLLMLAVNTACYSLSDFLLYQEQEIINTYNTVIDEITSLAKTGFRAPKSTNISLDQIKSMLLKEGYNLNIVVINKVLTTLKCANQYNVQHNNILTVIDYSLPSNEKRLWVFDLKEKKLLFNTYVSHGIKSGALLTQYFSNINNSKASSIGVYKTDKTYYGRDGLSLRLDGLERGFNDNASTRNVVMHGGWYVEENFIKKYGRPGRSWGCPALPMNMTHPIINTIKENSFFVVYYPSDSWFAKSKFLNCQNFAANQNTTKPNSEFAPLSDYRENILFADLKHNNRLEENDPIVVMTADGYQKALHTPPPLERMLRRQINNVEYIALSDKEFKIIVSQNSKILNDDNKDPLTAVYFVIPVIKMNRGYYETQMKIVNIGKIKDVRFNSNSTNPIEAINNYIVELDSKPLVNLKATNQFIRWVGL